MPFGISRYEMRQLADYNAEVARGLVHTLEWQTRMALLQDRFDQASSKIAGSLAPGTVVTGWPLTEAAREAIVAMKESDQ